MCVYVYKVAEEMLFKEGRHRRDFRRTLDSTIPAL